jgi:hypothetical protein
LRAEPAEAIEALPDDVLETMQREVAAFVGEYLPE